MKKLVIIGASELQNPLILKAKSLGYETHVFAWECGDIGEKTADVFYPISIVEKEEILEKCREIKPAISRKVLTFGLDKSNDIYADNITYENGFPSFDVYYLGKFLGKITLGVYGEHNIMNSLAAILCALLSGIDFPQIKAGLSDFSGAKRRFEFKGKYKNAEVYDDYAHHPTEIETTINSAHKKNYNNLYIIFQPHTYTRTLALMDDFAKVLSKAENVIITDIYAAREKNIYGISSKDLAEKIPGAKYIAQSDDVINFIKTTVKENDLILTVGAGDVFKIGEALLDC